MAKRDNPLWMRKCSKSYDFVLRLRDFQMTLKSASDRLPPTLISRSESRVRFLDPSG